MKAAIYARTNQTEQSTLSQINLCREYIMKEGGSITGIYDDTGVSANEFPREGLSQLMKDADNFDTLVITSIDRLFRDAVKVQEFLDGLGQLNITLVLVKESE